MTIKEIESDLETGQTAPQTLASYSDWLSAQSSRLMDRELGIENTYAIWFTGYRKDYQSDKAANLKWRTTELGQEQALIETTQRKITLLLRTISKHLRVYSEQARNMY